MDAGSGANGGVNGGGHHGEVKSQYFGNGAAAEGAQAQDGGKPRAKTGSRRKTTSVDTAEADDSAKRRCVSTACIACRKRKSKCDGSLPACTTCSVYGTECTYDPNSDHRRKGVYKHDISDSKTRNSTLQTLIQALLNSSDEDVPALVREIRTCESLDAVAEKLASNGHGVDLDEDEDEGSVHENGTAPGRTFETQLYGKMGDLRLDEGSVRYIGGTSHLIHLAQDDSNESVDEYPQQEDPIASWTNVTSDPELVVHLLNMYFTWHYTYFTTMSKTLFYRDFLLGKPPPTAKRRTYYCSPLLVNAVLALGCHFTSHSGARLNPDDSATAGDHFFKEAKRLIMENDEHERSRLTTVQALGLMSVREAGCGREAKGWVYSGMGFRMSLDMGLNLDSGRLTKNKGVNGDEAEEDVRRITFWGSFLFDKCWSNYLGRLPQIPTSIITVPKVDVFPDEDSAQWSPYSDSGFTQAHSQPARTRTVALQLTKLCEISNDLMQYFYNPVRDVSKGKATELRKLSDIHTRLEAWRRELPKELEPKEGGLASVLVMHMFFQLLFIHLFRPFLKYTQQTSPLPQNVSPRKLCTQAAGMISKLMRLYKRSHGLRQICNITVYIVHSACTIHLLNLPEKNARRDIVHGVKHLEEIAEGWLCARRTLGILSVLARKWNVELPEEAATVLARTDAKFGSYVREVQSPSGPQRSPEQNMTPSSFATHVALQNPAMIPSTTGYFNGVALPPATTNTTGGAPSASTAAAAVVRDYALPPDDASDLRALQYPSAQVTPTNSLQGHRRQQSSMGAMTAAASPSDMFGGVEQLIRDSSDWVYRDQAQYAENWHGVEVDPSAWVTGPSVSHNGTNGVGGGGAVSSAMSMPMPSSAAAAYTGTAIGNGVPGGFPPNSWLVGLNPYNSVATYNEDEWYQ
ncbi:Nitrogen assimilation transcription factor nit-4 [Friedmanniomyces endolithicus]|nr:Nitrogen assimilation transcription factor nit-4 [Friedmanniomyces endolithicus]